MIVHQRKTRYYLRYRIILKAICQISQDFVKIFSLRVKCESAAIVCTLLIALANCCSLQQINTDRSSKFEQPYSQNNKMPNKKKTPPHCILKSFHWLTNDSNKFYLRLHLWQFIARLWLIYAGSF